MEPEVMDDRPGGVEPVNGTGSGGPTKAPGGGSCLYLCLLLFREPVGQIPGNGKGPLDLVRFG
jgi:hypothetical protein